MKKAICLITIVFLMVALDSCEDNFNPFENDPPQVEELKIRSTGRVRTLQEDGKIIQYYYHHIIDYQVCRQADTLGKYKVIYLPGDGSERLSSHDEQFFGKSYWDGIIYYKSGEYTFAIKATDEYGNVGIDSVRVTVLPLE